MRLGWWWRTSREARKVLWMSGSPFGKKMQTEKPLGSGDPERIYIYMGVSKNRGTPKWMVYNGKTLLKWMIWGYPYLWKHPYIHIYTICFQNYKTDEFGKYFVPHHSGQSINWQHTLTLNSWWMRGITLATSDMSIQVNEVWKFIFARHLSSD